MLPYRTITSNEEPEFKSYPDSWERVSMLTDGPDRGTSELENLPTQASGFSR